MGIFGSPLSGEEISIVLALGAIVVYLYNKFLDYEYRIEILEDDFIKSQNKIKEVEKRMNSFNDKLAIKYIQAERKAKKTK